MRIAIAFMATAAASAIATFALVAADVPPWPFWILFLFVGLILMQVRPLESLLPPAMVFYACLFIAMFGLSLPESGNPRVQAVRVVGQMGLLGVSSISLLVMALRSKGKAPAAMWLTSALILASFIAMASGDVGGASPMRHFFMRFMSAESAEVAVWIARKSVHVTFYGTLALLVYRATAAAKKPMPWVAVAFAVAHGTFDEYRQFTAATVRFGSPVDVGIDATGALLVLFLAGAFRRRESKQKVIE